MKKSKVRHLITSRDFTAAEIRQLIRSGIELKRKPLAVRTLTGKTLGLLFLKPSVRTRVSFEVGMAQLGGQAVYMGAQDLGGGAKREAPRDMGLVLSRFLDAIVVRTFSQQEIELMASGSSVPIINGLSDHSHPCQALADILTIYERVGKLKGTKVAYLGDGNNVCHSLMEVASVMGVDIRVAAPKGYAPDAEVSAWCKQQNKKSGGRLTVTTDPEQAVSGARILYTDVWTSMGQESERARRKKLFKPYQVNSKLMGKAARGALFMHCLPAHRGEEVSDELLDSPVSIVYDQAENRMHMQKAVLLELLSSSRKRGSQ